MRDLVFRVERVDWCHDYAERCDGMKDYRVVRTVWTQDSKDLAFLEPALLQVVGHDGDRIRQLGISDRPARRTIDERRFVRKLVNSAQDQGRQSGLGDLDIRVGAFDYHVAQITQILVICEPV